MFQICTFEDNMILFSLLTRKLFLLKLQGNKKLTNLKNQCLKFIPIFCKQKKQI